MQPALLAFIAILVSISSYFGVRLLINWALRHQVIDIPNERSSHSQPTPRGGGLLIFLTTLIGWLAYLFITRSAWINLPVLAYLAGAVAIAFISWRDDLKPLPTWLRFGVHSAAAILAMIAMGYWPYLELPLLGSLRIGWFGLPLTFLWIVGLTNAYNFMDGIDGLAGGQAVVAALGWVWLAWCHSQPSMVALALLLAAASIGFLVHNWSPARIFMGDVGSAFLGYTFAVLPLFISPTEAALPTAAVVLLWPFIFDASFTLLRRLRNGERIFAAHRSHLYQRLVVTGLSHQTVTLLYLVLAMVNVILALWWVTSRARQDFLGLFLLLEALALWLLVIYHEYNDLIPRHRT